ncbi:MAG: PmoA family protein [Kiritimatiellae bacterium]|nr:PmoA family protein [Kiritimatiellia bacterium]
MSTLQNRIVRARQLAGSRTDWKQISACCLFLCVGSPFFARAQAGFTFREDPGRHVDVLLDDKPVVRYMITHVPSSDPKSLTATNKPFLHLFDPQGKELITNSGNGGEHPHHRGIMIGWTKTTFNGKLYNFWGMYNNAQIHRSFSVWETDRERAVLTSQVDWITHAGETVIREARTITVRRADAPAYAQVDVDSTLAACLGDVLLNGDPEHAGVQFRAADETLRAATRFAYPGADTDPRKVSDPPWVAAQFTLAGKVYGVVQMNNTGNPRGSRISAYRNYCRFGYFPAPVTLKPGQPFTLRYRFLAFADGLPQTETLQRVCAAYTGCGDASPAVTARPAEQPAR